MDCEVFKPFRIAPCKLVIHAEIRCSDGDSYKAHSQAFLRVEYLFQEGGSALLAHLEEIVATRPCEGCSETVYFLVLGLRINVHYERGLSRILKTYERDFGALKKTLAVGSGDICRGFAIFEWFIRDFMIDFRSGIASGESDTGQNDCRDEIDHIYLLISFPANIA